ncbi:zinc finger CCCH domain-containing protein 13 isoform X5 [Heterodontus francisci]|uniref:zinc finger CCCH domain-containing protein 13 isoform X5 n=1 Tax=Heterodontus francisci TaxID=7792 RepID=UPI00355AE1E5
MSKVRRKVTVENSKTISESTSRRPSVFERLGPSTGSSAETQCRNWMKTGHCPYGNTCRFTHGSSPRGKGYSATYRRSPERPTGDLRERMKNKRQDVESEPQKRAQDESSSPPRRETSRSRHRDKEDANLKITKERTPESEEEPADWEAGRDDSDNGDVNYDYDHELSLEMKRQKIQRELMKLEQENMEKREEIVIKKEISPEPVRSKHSPSPRKASKSPKRKSSPKLSLSGKKEKRGSRFSSPAGDQQRRSSKVQQGRKKGPRTPSPPPPILEEIPVTKKHKEKLRAKERSEEKTRDRERGRDLERHKEKKEKHSRSPSSQRQHQTPTVSRQHSPSSRSGSTGTRRSPSPHHKRSTSPSYRRAASPSRRRSPSPYAPRSSSPQRKQSPIRHRSSGREKGKHEQEKSPLQERRREKREESRGKREREKESKDSRDQRDYELDQGTLQERDERMHRESRDTRNSRDRKETKENSERREHRESREARDTRDTRDYRDSKDSRDLREPRSGRDAHDYRESRDSHRKDEQYHEDRNYSRSHGRDENSRTDARSESRNDARSESRNDARSESRNDARSESRNERTARGRGRGSDLTEKGSRGTTRGTQFDIHSTSSSYHENWDTRSGYTDRDRYDRDQSRDASFDRRGHTERDRRENRDREREHTASSATRHPGRTDDHDHEDRKDERRSDREERRDDRLRERERERDRDKDRDRDREREKERELDRERERERVRERDREKEREKERERDRGKERERDRERERERDREKEREREKIKDRDREREKQKDWDEKDKGRDERKDKKDDQREDRDLRESHGERRTRKRPRTESSLSPLPKRAREESPDSDTYNSSDEKSEKHRLLSQVVRPQDSRSLSPPRVIEDRTSSWKEDDRKSDKKESTRRREDHMMRERITSGDKQREHIADTVESSRSRESDSTAHHATEDREVPIGLHEYGKKKTKGQRKSQKRNRRDEDFVSEKYIPEAIVEETLVLSPRKPPKKKNIDKKRKRSKGDSEPSDEEVVPQAKKWKGPRTPPVTLKEESIEEVSEKSVEGNAQGGGDVVFSDWSDGDVPDREESIISDKSVDESRRKSHRSKMDKIEPPTTADDRPRKTDEHKRSSSLGSNRSRTSSRLRSPSNESIHRSGDDQSGGRRLQHGTSRDGQKYRNIESGERKSRIDQLKRGEPSRSTSSDRQDSRSHSSRRSSPESDRQGRSRAGSFESREKLQENEHDRDRERRERKEWERDGEHRDWVKTRDRNRDRRREINKEREKPPAELPDKDKERTLEAASILEQPRVEPRLERELEKQFEQVETAAVISCERDVNELVKEPENEEIQVDEAIDSIEGEQDGKVDDAQSSVSGACEEYEPISDDELDEILADDAGKREENQDEEKVSDPMDVIDVDWSSLLPKQPKEPREPGAALLKFTPGAILLRAGISKRLAGADLFAKVNETCRAAINNAKDAENLFEHELGALNMAAMQRKEERASLLSNLGPCCKALCSRRDLAIRKQLVRNEKGTIKQMYTNQPVVDNDLLRSSLRLFKRKALCHGPVQEKSDETKISRPKVKQEVCVT